MRRAIDSRFSCWRTACIKPSITSTISRRKRVSSRRPGPHRIVPASTVSNIAVRVRHVAVYRNPLHGMGATLPPAGSPRHRRAARERRRHASLAYRRTPCRDRFRLLRAQLQSRVRASRRAAALRWTWVRVFPDRGTARGNIQPRDLCSSSLSWNPQKLPLCCHWKRHSRRKYRTTGGDCWGERGTRCVVIVFFPHLLREPPQKYWVGSPQISRYVRSIPSDSLRLRSAIVMCSAFISF
jgi:hypothetical protein